MLKPLGLATASHHPQCARRGGFSLNLIQKRREDETAQRRKVLKDEARQEYIKHHKDVDSDASLQKALDETIKDKKMDWVQDFMAEGEKYKEKYVDNLVKTKGKMRSEVYGDLQALQTDA